jgi:hypothetical protein
MAVIVAITVQFLDLRDTNALLPPPLAFKANATLEIAECASSPPVNFAAEKEMFCATTSVNEDSSMIENPIVTFRTILECENELLHVVADMNRTIQRMEKEYRKVLNETYHKLDSLEEKLGKQEQDMKATAERLQISRKQVSEFNEELRKMHAAAVRQYLNTTLMREDLWNGIDKAFTKAARRLERRWGNQYRRMMHLMYLNKQKWTKMRMRVRSHLQPRLVLFQRNMQNRWRKSTIVRPLIDRMETMVKGTAYELYRPLRPIIDEVEVAFRLTTVSAIEEGSKTVINFLEKDEQLHLVREQSRSKRKDSMHRHLELSRRNRRHKSPDHKEFPRREVPKPSLMNLKARAFFKYALENSNQIYADITTLAPLAFTLYLSRCFIIGSLGWFIGIPSPVIWAVVICRMVKRRMKTQ